MTIRPTIDEPETTQPTATAATTTVLQKQPPSSTSFPLLPITSPETLLKCSTLPLRSTDVFICSYPKSGTTWTQHIVLSLLIAAAAASSSASAAAEKDQEEECQRRGDNNDDAEEKRDLLLTAVGHVSEFAPFYEIDPHWEQQQQDEDESGFVDGSSANDDSSEHQKPVPRLAPSVVHNHSRLGRRVFNTHLHWNMLPHQSSEKNEDGAADATTTSSGRFIYLLRHALDAFVSFYHHLSHQIGSGYDMNYTINQFFQEWIEGKVYFGSYLDHLLSFAQAFAIQAKDDEGGAGAAVEEDGTQREQRQQRLLLLRYEDMVTDLPPQVDRIVSFLGLDDTLSHDVIEELLPTFTFHDMKENIDKFQPISVEWKKNQKKTILANGQKEEEDVKEEEEDEEFCFLRKGKVGNYRQYLKDEQLIQFRQWVERERYVEKVTFLFGETNPEALEAFLDVVRV